MRGHKFLEEVKLTNLLSYGRGGVSLRLEPLNVLVGPNAAGKSNLIEALSLLAAAPRDLLEPFRNGGGVDEWIWKGAERSPRAEIEIVVGDPNLKYRLAFTSMGYRLLILAETLENALSGPDRVRPYSYYDFRTGKASIARGVSAEREEQTLQSGDDLSSEQSIFSQRKDSSLYPELTLIGRQFGRMRFYRDWSLSRGSVLRRPQQADLPNDYLEEDASNLALIINSLLNRPTVKNLLVENLRLLYEEVVDIATKVEGGTVQIFFHERELDTAVPATRLSDGTLRFLCLLAILCHPKPPPLVCIEEPELGLHPDAIQAVAKLLLDASQRTQLVVTTHSDALVSALSEVPEAIVVCERSAAGTSLRRLEPAKLAEWLERYRLGELWRMGEIGGTRW